MHASASHAMPPETPRALQGPRVEGEESAQAHVDVARWLTQAARRDPESWDRLVEVYARRVFALAKSRLGDPDVSEEVAQSVFVTVARVLCSPDGGGYQERGRFESWLFRITMNRVRDEARRRRRTREGVARFTQVQRDRGGAEGEPTAGGGGVREAGVLGRGDGGDDLARLRRAMERLGHADREVVELRHHADMSFQTIAETLGEPLGTVLARHHRALKKLRKMLGESGVERSTEGGRDGRQDTTD